MGFPFAAALATAAGAWSCGLPPAASSGETVSITIDATTSRTPIDDRLYGMFIEHQGRCIYGGLWAEMLDDRKFYYEIQGTLNGDTHRSPWSRAAPFTVVSMDKESAYVGEQAVKVTSTLEDENGIQQGGLSLEKGRAYTGYVVVSADPGVGVQVTLNWGAGPDSRQVARLTGVSSTYVRRSFKLTAGADTIEGSFQIAGKGKGVFRVGTASLMPSDNVEGLRADTLKLLKEVQPSIIRWPGGGFVDFHDWKEAIGERDKRRPELIWAYRNPAVESNDFGLHEFLRLCELLGSKPFLVVPALQASDAVSAAEVVEYCNGSSSSNMGALRVKNGQTKPFGVRLWGVGNETWASMTVDTFIQVHKKIQAAMIAADPSLEIVAVGGAGINTSKNGDDWTASMIKQCGGQMDLISEHIYAPAQEDLREHANSIRRRILTMLEKHRQLRASSATLRHIPIAFEEWNYGSAGCIEFYGEAGIRFNQGHALGIAAALMALYDSSDLVEVATLHGVNVFGYIKTNATDAAFETTGLAYKLLRTHYGKHPLTLGGDLGEDLDPVGASAALTEDGTALTLAVVNPSDDPVLLSAAVEGSALGGEGRHYYTTADDAEAYNEPGKSPAVTIAEEAVVESAGTPLWVPARSVNLFRLELAP
jgi:alpha-L-arabinofuranosidase